MGLKTWKKSPVGRIIKSDVSIAKNYLDETEIKRLERLTSGYFDYLERIVENRVTLKMEDLAESVGKFLSFNEYRLARLRLRPMNHNPVLVKNR
nr:MAG: Virulence protein RhuM family protein [Candidatus Kentron sp. LPFa]